MKRAVKKKKQRILNKLFAGGAIFAALQIMMPTKPVSALPVLPNNPDSRNNVNIATSDDKLTMDITGNIQNGFIAWRDFSVALGETVNFSGMTNMLNYVVAVNPSLIYGTINAPTVQNFYIINPNGIYFGKDSFINTNHLLVSTRTLSDTDIDNYINGGNPLGTGIDKLINNNDEWFRSANVTGTYDVADGDVMFLGKVQADNVTVEGNTIQIRNTKNFTNKAGNTILSGDKMKLYSNNPIEVGYEVNTSGIDFSTWGLVEPFDTLTEETTRTRDEAINTLAQQYNIYIGTGDSAEILALNAEIIAHNRQVLGGLYDYFCSKAPTDRTSPENKLLAIAMDKYIRKNLTKQFVVTGEGAYTKTQYNDVYVSFYSENNNTYVWNDETNTNEDRDPDYLQHPVTATVTTSVTQKVNTLQEIPVSFDVDVTAEFEKLQAAYNNRSNYANKYFVADKLGDTNMTNSGSKLNYTVKTLNRAADGSIRDFRLIQSVADLELVNKSSYDNLYQLIPEEGIVSGNYMLDADLNLTGRNFKPLGYAMTYKDFTSASDQIHFNGLNFTISGLKTDTSTGKYQGLFSVFSGSVKNLRLKDVTVGAGITASDKEIRASGGLIGAVVGAEDTSLDTTFKNVSVTGNVAGEYAGGLVGATGAGENEVISETTAVLTVETDDETLLTRMGNDDYELVKHQVYDGGSGSEDFMYGYTIGSPYDLGTNTVSPGSAKVVFSNVDSFMSGTTTDGVSGDIAAGGILGYGKRGELSFTNSINAGNITSSGGNAGGLLGSLYYAYPSVIKINAFKNLANTGAVTAKNYAGGLAGYFRYSEESTGGGYCRQLQYGQHYKYRRSRLCGRSYRRRRNCLRRYQIFVQHR